MRCENLGDKRCEMQADRARWGNLRDNRLDCQMQNNGTGVPMRNGLPSAKSCTGRHVGA